MIVSHKYKYIFLKTNKTAGTSVEIALSSYCGDEDIIAGIAKEDERLVLPRAKSSFRKDQRSYRELLSDKEAETIRAMFQDELSLLGYEY